ncbi:MAG TPA: cbb3-type cytochrome c oxidase subunit I [Gammaproteobacteria bacterium]
MSDTSGTAGLPADSSSDGWGLPLQPEHLAAARRWLWLGLAALAGAGLFAVLLVLARTPGAQQWLPGIDLFRVALVTHVDLSVLVWFLACAGFLWTLRDGPRGAWGSRAFGLAVAGAAGIVLAPLTGGGPPVLSNYVPVLAQPLFLGGLALFAAGIALRAFLCAERGLEVAHGGPVAGGLFLVAVATLLAGFTLARTLLKLPPVSDLQVRYELLFWPVGHVLQFAYTALALVAWLWLATGTGLRLLLSARATTLLLLTGALPLLGVPLIEISTLPGSGDQRVFYTLLMRWGGLWPAVPIGLLVLLACLTGPRPAPAQRPARSALYASLLLYAVGVAGALASPDLDALLPGQVRGTVTGVSLALMGLAYHLLPRFGRAVPGRPCLVQTWLFAGGQLLTAVAVAWSVRAVDAGTHPAVTAAITLGHLLAALGLLLFVLLCARTLLGGDADRDDQLT